MMVNVARKFTRQCRYNYYPHGRMAILTTCIHPSHVCNKYTLHLQVRPWEAGARRRDSDLWETFSQASAGATVAPDRMQLPARSTKAIYFTRLLVSFRSFRGEPRLSSVGPNRISLGKRKKKKIFIINEKYCKDFFGQFNPFDPSIDHYIEHNKSLYNKFWKLTQTYDYI